MIHWKGCLQNLALLCLPLPGLYLHQHNLVQLALLVSSNQITQTQEVKCPQEGLSSLSTWDYGAGLRTKSLSDPSGTDLSLVFSPSPSSSSSSRPVSDYYYKCLIYHIQAWGSPQPIHFLKAHDISSPNTDENTNTKTKTVTKTMTKTKTPREWLKQ